MNALQLFKRKTMTRKRIQLGLIHMAIAMTLVPINSTLNRVMIFDLGISKTLFTLLAIFPYLLSPVQVAIGSFSDRHPVFGYRRTPYILAGLILCVLGVAASPQVAILISRNFTYGVIAGILAFGMWGMGYNLSAVCYLSLASELSGEKGRGKTVATMFTMMVIGLIVTGISLSRLVPVYVPEMLTRAFLITAAAALVLGLLGLIKLEPPFNHSARHSRSETYGVKQMASAITENPVAKIFFFYLLLLLAAMLGQDVLLEPFGAQAFDMTLEQTSRIVSITNSFTLLAFIIAGWLDGRVKKKYVAQSGNLGAMLGFLMIVISGFSSSLTVFYIGITLLGLGTGISTIANLSLMFDLTVPEKVGLYIGAWGFSNGLSRLVGLLLAGVVADVVTGLTGNALSGYLMVFILEALMLFAAAVMLYRIDVKAFQMRAQDEPAYFDKVALVSE